VKKKVRIIRGISISCKVLYRYVREHPIVEQKLGILVDPKSKYMNTNSAVVMGTLFGASNLDQPLTIKYTCQV
jgi:hypothetical protein